MTVENPMPNSQKCKFRSLNRLATLAKLKEEIAAKRAASSEQRWRLALLLDEAQVWATLATVPEPLEELAATELISAPTIGATFPTLICPHGYHAKLVPASEEEVDGVNFPTNLRYTFSPDCGTCP